MSEVATLERTTFSDVSASLELDSNLMVGARLAVIRGAGFLIDALAEESRAENGIYTGEAKSVLERRAAESLRKAQVVSDTLADYHFRVPADKWMAVINTTAVEFLEAL